MLIGEDMVNILNPEVEINKERIYKNLHIVENTESYNCTEDCFFELSQIIKDNMKLTCIYDIVDYSFVAHDYETERFATWDKCVLCFASSNDEISNIVKDMMSSGDYLKGYLLNEIATDVLFNCSDKMNKIIKEEVTKLGCKLTKRFAPGDGILSLNYQNTILEALKKDVCIDAHLTETYMIVPERSMLYLYGVENNAAYNQHEMHEDCSECSKLNCQYRK